MIDRPDAPALLEAMAATLADAVVPACEGPPQHAARVVANLCRILAREFEHGVAATEQTTSELRLLLGSDAGLSELVVELERRLESGGEVDPMDDDQLFSVLKANVDRRLAVAKPSYIQDVGPTTS